MIDLYISKPEEAAEYNAFGEPELPESECMKPDEEISATELSMLWAILEDREPRASDADAFERAHEADDGEEIILRIPAAIVAGLSRLDEPSIAVAAERWLRTNEVLWVCTSTAKKVLSNLACLARSAQATGKSLYLYFHA